MSSQALSSGSPVSESSLGSGLQADLRAGQVAFVIGALHRPKGTVAPCLIPRLFMLQLSPSWVPGLPVRPFPSRMQTLLRAAGLDRTMLREGLRQMCLGCGSC